MLFDLLAARTRDLLSFMETEFQCVGLTAGQDLGFAVIYGDRGLMCLIYWRPGPGICFHLWSRLSNVLGLLAARTRDLLSFMDTLIQLSW